MVRVTAAGLGIAAVAAAALAAWLGWRTGDAGTWKSPVMTAVWVVPGVLVAAARPRLPIGIDRLTIHRLKVGTAEVDLTFQRVGDRVAAFAEGQDPSPVPLLLHS